MHPEEFSHYNLRVNLDLILRYGNLGHSVTKIIHRLAHDEDHPTVVHVHIDVPLDRTSIPGRNVLLYEMPGMVGLSDSLLHASCLFNTTVAESYLTDADNNPLRRLDIHFDKARKSS